MATKFPATLRVYVGPKLAAKSQSRHKHGSSDGAKCVFGQALNKKYRKLFGHEINISGGGVWLDGASSKDIYKGNARQIKAEHEFEKTGKVKAGHYSFRLV